jgi:orotate phosphoribosyltransferase
MSDSRSQLLRLLSRISFKLGEFTLSSGAKSDYYIDCRLTTLHAEGARLCGEALLELFARNKLRPAAVGGLTMGADPVVSAVAIASAIRAHAVAGEELIHGFLVRKTEKTHGTGRRVEGFVAEGAPVVIVDDVCTTGGSTLDAVAAARAAGMRVVGAACLVERREAKGRAALEEALAGAPFLSLFTADDVRVEHIAHMAL